MKSFLLGVATGVTTLILAGGVGGYLWMNDTGDIAKRTEVTFAPTANITAQANVKEHTKIFAKKTYEVTDGVHLAIGYGLANVIVIEAPEGLILVDTLESIRSAENLEPWIDELRQSTGKDITDLIYTHNHADHVLGAGVMIRNQDTTPRIWAHEDTKDRVHEVVNMLAPVTFRRAMRMFGVYLADENFENNGIGPRLLNDDQDAHFFLIPTDVVQDRTEVEMAGEKVILQHAPGETSDQLVIYLPDRKILLPADNYYHAFPNIYTVRGTPYRDPRFWAKSIDVMRSFNAEIMIPQHSLPVLGAENVENVLRDYRDAIQYVYDATIRMINSGLTPDQISENIKLPPHLANAPHLQEMYGKVSFAARAIFSGTLGWFTGDPADLQPVTGLKKAQLMADLAGGQDALVKAAKNAIESEPAWALTLATQLLELEHAQAQELRVAALNKLAEGESASSVRNYYLTSAAEAQGFQLPSPGFSPETPEEVINGFPVLNFLNVMAVNLKADQNLDRELAYGFDFTDAPSVTIRIRRGVAIIEEGLASDRLGALKASSDTFRGIAVDHLDPAKLLLNGDLSTEGSIKDMQDFLSNFTKNM